VIAVVDKEEAAAVESVSLQSVDDASEAVNLLKQNGDLVCEQSFAVE
jgi:hypothetical protein